jgi:hypothetical protein
VTTGTLQSELTFIAPITRAAGGVLQPSEFTLTAGWGHAGKDGATMPGRGKALLRVATPGELAPAFITNGTARTWDIWLNDAAYWKNIPPAVWDYTIGGYQVIKKWLSYREQPLLGRPLTANEVREVTAIARRIAALILLQDKLDANYKVVVADT